MIDNGRVDGAVAEKKPPFWKRKNKTTREAELGAVGAGVAAGAVAEEKHHHNKRNGNFRPSDDTGMTGSTAAQDVSYGGPNTKYGQESTLPGQEPIIPPAGSATRPEVVVHDPNPYAEVHHGGFIHAHNEQGGYTNQNYGQ